MKRHDMRRADQLRPMTVTYNIFEYAAGSVLFELGKTRLLCAVTLQPSVPQFLRGKGMSWLMAEYALLPASTQVRTNREASIMRRSGRSIEISRLISRVLRTVIDNTVLGERTIVVDCDVLQADGSTRTTAITGACAALMMAQQRWLEDGIIERPFLKEGIAGVSIGILGGGILGGILENNLLVIDPDYHEDSSSVADLNIIMTHSGRLIEVLGGAEKEPIDWECMIQAGKLARAGIDKIVSFFDTHKPPSFQSKHATKAPLFSLKNRQQQQM